jgi:transcriptional regulator NrdR family protein
MKCMACDEPVTKVLDTRVIPERPQWNKRRRKCLNCEHVFWTVELPAEDFNEIYEVEQ